MPAGAGILAAVTRRVEAVVPEVGDDIQVGDHGHELLLVSTCTVRSATSVGSDCVPPGAPSGARSAPRLDSNREPAIEHDDVPVAR